MKKNIRNAVRAVVVNGKNQILLVYDSEKDFFQLPGGGIQEDENIRDAVIRETFEETGYVISIIEVLDEYIEDLGDLTNRTTGYLARVAEESKQALEYDELGYQNTWHTHEKAISLIQKQTDDENMKEFRSFNSRELHFLKLVDDIINK